MLFSLESLSGAPTIRLVADRQHGAVSESRVIRPKVPSHVGRTFLRHLLVLRGFLDNTPTWRPSPIGHRRAKCRYRDFTGVIAGTAYSALYEWTIRTELAYSMRRLRITARFDHQKALLVAVSYASGVTNPRLGSDFVAPLVVSLRCCIVLARSRASRFGGMLLRF